MPEQLYILPPRAYCDDILGSTKNYTDLANLFSKGKRKKFDVRAYKKQRAMVEDQYLDACILRPSMKRGLELSGGAVVYDRLDRPVRLGLGLRGGAGKVRWVDRGGNVVVRNAQGATRQRRVQKGLHRYEWVDEPEEPEPETKGIWENWVGLGKKKLKLDVLKYKMSKEAREALNECGNDDEVVINSDWAEEKSGKLMTQAECWKKACALDDDPAKCLEAARARALGVKGLAKGILEGGLLNANELVASFDSWLDGGPSKVRNEDWEQWFGRVVYNAKSGAVVGAIVGGTAIATGGASVLAAGAVGTIITGAVTAGGGLKNTARILARYGLKLGVWAIDMIIKHPIAAQVTFLIIKKFIKHGCTNLRNALQKQKFLQKANLVPTGLETVKYEGSDVSTYEFPPPKVSLFDPDFFTFSGQQALHAATKSGVKSGIKVGGTVLSGVASWFGIIGTAGSFVIGAVSDALGQASEEYIKVNLYAQDVFTGGEYFVQIIVAMMQCIDFEQNMTREARIVQLMDKAEDKEISPADKREIQTQIQNLKSSKEIARDFVYGLGGAPQYTKYKPANFRGTFDKKVKAAEEAAKAAEAATWLSSMLP